MCRTVFYVLSTIRIEHRDVAIKTRLCTQFRLPRNSCVSVAVRLGDNQSHHVDYAQARRCQPFTCARIVGTSSLATINTVVMKRNSKWSTRCSVERMMSWLTTKSSILIYRGKIVRPLLCNTGGYFVNLKNPMRFAYIQSLQTCLFPFTGARTMCRYMDHLLEQWKNAATQCPHKQT